MSQKIDFKDRGVKEVFLKEIIKKLTISEIEKDIYLLSIEVLSEDDFEDFFKKIQGQINNTSSYSIAPLTSTLI